MGNRGISWEPPLEHFRFSLQILPHRDSSRVRSIPVRLVGHLVQRRKCPLMLGRFLVIACALLMTGNAAFAHGGGLDTLGCHHDRKAGGYHCHQGSMAGQAFGSKNEAVQHLMKPPAAPPPGITGKARIIDGDTIEIAGNTIHLFGIDAPEAEQTCMADGSTYRCGWEATNALAYETANQWLRCEPKGKTSDGLMVAICHVGPHDLGARMVRAGWALADRTQSEAYVDAEAKAMDDHLGLWAGEFIAPSTFREKQRKK